jgi:hypothetical protein
MSMLLLEVEVPHLFELRADQALAAQPGDRHAGDDHDNCAHNQDAPSPANFGGQASGHHGDRGQRSQPSTSGAGADQLDSDPDANPDNKEPDRPTMACGHDAASGAIMARNPPQWSGFPKVEKMLGKSSPPPWTGSQLWVPGRRSWSCSRP